MKKTSAFILSAMLLLSMVAGISTAAAATSADAIVFTAATTSDLGSLYPYGINKGTKQAVRGVLYEPLFWKDYDGELHGVLAKSYTSLGNGVYSIELFDYIYDSAGNHMTAADVIYSIDLWRADGKGSANYASLTKWEATGDYTLELTFENERLGAFDKCVCYCYCVTQAAWEASPDGMTEDPCGTGRYKLTDYLPDSWYNFEKRDDYWQTDENYITAKNSGLVDYFNVQIVADYSTLAIALENREIDYATKEIVEADRANFMNEDGTAKEGYYVEVFPTTADAHITFNCSENSLCHDIYLRKAIATCIDAAAIAKNVQGSYGYPATSSLVPTVGDADESLNASGSYYAYDLQAAKDLLAQSSYNGETLKLLVKPNSNTWDTAILVQAYCDKAGIKVELLQYENALYNSTREDQTGTLYDMDLGGMSTSNEYAWKAYVDLDLAARINVSQIMIVDDTMTDLFNKAASVETGGVEAANALVQYVDEQCYIYNIFYYGIQFIGTDRIQSMVIDANLESIFTAFTVTP